MSGAGLQPIAWSNATRTFRVSAQNTKTNAKIERVSFDDRLGEGDFGVWNAALTHNLRWGRGSRLRSAIDRTDRSGANPYLRETWSEQLHLQHDIGASDVSLQRHRSETASGVSRSRTLGYSYSTRLQRWLTVGARASGRSARANGNSETVYAAGPNVGLNLRLPADLRMTATGAFGYETRNRERSGDPFVDVINERHAVDETRSFLLDQTDIDPTSVIARSADETIVFLEDIDYRLVELDRLLEVIVIPGGRIDVGTVVLVSYRFDPVAFASGDVITGRYDFSLSRGSFTLRHSRSMRDSDNGEGDVLLGLGTFDEIQTSLSGTVGTPLGRWELDFRRNSRSSSAFDFTSHELRTTLAVPTGRGLQWSIGASGRKTRDDDQRLTSRSAHTTVSWKLARPARLRGRIQAWDLTISDQTVDRSFSGDVSLHLRIAAVESIIRFVYNRRVLPAVLNTSRLTGRVVRSF